MKKFMAGAGKAISDDESSPAPSSTLAENGSGG
jgi:hypothetical protein